MVCARETELTVPVKRFFILFTKKNTMNIYIYFLSVEENKKVNELLMFVHMDNKKIMSLLILIFDYSDVLLP